MSLPRFIRPERYWLVTRRTLNQMFLLLPEDWVRQLFAYALARAAAETRVQVIGGVVMSSHYHVVVYDPGAELPRFVQLLDELVARAANVEWGRSDYFWDSRRARFTELLTPEAIEEAVVYCLTNPQEAGLVARSSAWEHWQSRPRQLGRSVTVRRPRLAFFGRRSRLPDAYTLELRVPRTHAAGGDEAWRALIARRLARSEAEIHAEREGRPYWGMERVRAFGPTDVAPSVGGRGDVQPLSKVGQLEHAVAAHEVYRELVGLFRAAHRAAFLDMQAGRQALFPHGTYRWRIHAGQRCREAVAT